MNISEGYRDRQLKFFSFVMPFADFQLAVIIKDFWN